jgi:hypothetical protein
LVTGISCGLTRLPLLHVLGVRNPWIVLMQW